MSGKKVVIVGGVAGGAGTAARLRRLDEAAQITVFERGDYISFANCGLPYYIGNVIDDREELLVMSPELMKKRFRVDVYTRHEVTAINREKKYVEVKDLNTGEVTQALYDKLVLATGSSPFVPDIPGTDLPNVYTIWNMKDTDAIKTMVSVQKPETAVVIGGGFIGLEMTENLTGLGVKTTLVEMLPQVLPNIDADMAAILANRIRSHGVDLKLEETAQSIEKTENGLLLHLESGEEISTQLIILAVGVRPNSSLAEQAGLTLNARKGIVVNNHLLTSDPDIYAVGDVIEVTNYITGEKAMIPLAGPANKQGRICADNIAGRDSVYIGSMGTSIAKVFELAAGSVGLNERQLIASGKQLNKDYYIAKGNLFASASYYPGAKRLTLKVLFLADGTVVGAQAVGEKGVDKRIDDIATVIHFNGTVTDLKNLELCYAPPFSAAKDPVNMIGFIAENQLKDVCQAVTWDRYFKEHQGDMVLLDVRTPGEVANGKVDGALEIPVDEMRQRLSELDKQKTYAVYCAVGMRGYVACRILLQNGYKAVNVAGGYISYQLERQ